MSIFSLNLIQRAMARDYALQFRDELGLITASSDDFDRQWSSEQADLAFKRLAATLGYRVEPIENEGRTIVNFHGEVPALRSAARPGFDAKTGVPA